MKKTMLILACVITLATSACADNYQPITRDQLPQKAQTFLSTYFPKAKISLVRRDMDIVTSSYDVIFTDGCKIEFDNKGNWTEVDCINHPIPDGIAPATIENIVKTQYPGARITQIEIDHREYDVKLSNRIELTFDKKMQLIDID